MEPKQTRYPVALTVAGRLCVVVGGGRVATRKVESLLEAEAVVRVIAPHLSETLERHAATGRIAIERRTCQPGDIAGAWLAVAATNDRATNAAVATEARRERALAMICDDSAASDVTGVATIRRGGLTLTIGTDGASPAVARLLREELEAFLTPERLALLTLAADERERLRRSGRSVDRADWRAALSPDLLALLAAGDEAAARRGLRARLAVGDDRLEVGATSDRESIARSEDWR